LKRCPPAVHAAGGHRCFWADIVCPTRCSNESDHELTAPDQAAGERIFNALAQGGKVTTRFDDAFWGGRFGMLHDRFGNEWMVTSP
jgi:uncharacterized glyoxalase superfamily protein PhnB